MSMETKANTTNGKRDNLARLRVTEETSAGGLVVCYVFETNNTKLSHSPYKVVEDEDDTIVDTLVTLDTYHSDLNLIIGKTRYVAEPLVNDDFALMWAGAKATYGFNEGKICYEVKVVKHLNILRVDEANSHLVRVGWSMGDATLQLGEDQQSYGYESTAKSYTNCEFKDYGVEFKEEDVVTSFLDADSDPIELSFAVNGKSLGVAYSISREELGGKTLFPHILTKICSFETNFGQNEGSFFPSSDGYKEYVFAGKVEIEKRVRATKGPATRADCEVIMMCGLPSAGKTTWVSNYIAEHRDKNYHVLGTDGIINKMALLLRDNDADRRTILIDKSIGCLNRMLEIACRRRRNFILDQTNVYASAHRRTMKAFVGFKRKAVVVVPTDEEYKRRVAKCIIEGSNEVQNNAIFEMKTLFVLPEVGKIFNEVEYVELPEAEARVVVQQYVKEGKSNKQILRNDRRRPLMMTCLDPPSEIRVQQDGKRFVQSSSICENRVGHVPPLMGHTGVCGDLWSSGPLPARGGRSGFNTTIGSVGGSIGIGFNNYGGDGGRGRSNNWGGRRRRGGWSWK